MIRGMAVLLLFLFIGEVTSRTLNVPIPGNVIGMGLLLAALCAGIVRQEWIKEASELLLSHLALFFVPAGVGVMVYFDLIGREWLPIVAGMVLSTFVVMAVTGWVEERLEKRGERRVE